MRAGFARRPGFAQTAGPIRLARFEMQIGQGQCFDAFRQMMEHERSRRCERRVRLALGAQRPPERRKYFEWCAGLAGNRPWFGEQIGVEAFRGNAAFFQRAFDRRIDMTPGCVVTPVPEDSTCMARDHEVFDQRLRRTAQNVQSAAVFSQAFVKSLERAMQPPARSAAMRPQPVAPIVENIKADEGLSGLPRGVKRGIVREAQILTKPDNDGIAFVIQSRPILSLSSFSSSAPFAGI